MFSHTPASAPIESTRGKEESMKQHHYQEFKQSEIADDVIELNFRSHEGYEGFAQFVSLCDLKDNRAGIQVCDSHTHHRYSHLYEG